MIKELHKILESVVLTDEVKADLVEAIKAQKEQAVTEAKESLRVEYAEKFVKEKTDLALAIPDLIAEAAKEVHKDLAEEINYYKGLEIAYAEKMETFKADYNKGMTNKMVKMVESVVKEEVTELKQEIVEAKRAVAGTRIFEAILKNISEYGISGDDKALREELSQKTAELAESAKQISELKRTQVLEGLLKTLKGSKREVMASILENVKTENLESRYNEVIDRVLKEEKETKKEEKIVAEAPAAPAKSTIDLSEYRKLGGIN